MVIRYLMRTWVKTTVALLLAFTLGWFVVTRDIIHEKGIFQVSPYTEKPSAEKDTMPTTGNTVVSGNAIKWATVDLESKAIPESKLIKKPDVVIMTETKEIMGVHVFVREASPPTGVASSGQSLLLLHGQRFSSQNWEDLTTLSLMAALGHRVIAIDLPGYGRSGSQHFTGDKAKFLESVLTTLSLTRPVLVSPSMSGQFSLKFLELYSNLLSGFVPVAPVGTDTVNKTLLKDILVPSLLVYGDNDKTGLADRSARDALLVLPNSREVKLKEAGHAVYLDQPETFHKIMYNFMELLRD